MQVVTTLDAAILKHTIQACAVDVTFQNIAGMILLSATKNPGQFVECLNRRPLPAGNGGP